MLFRSNLIFTPVQGLNIEVGHLVNAFLEFTIITIMLYLIFQKIIKRFDPEAELELPHMGHMKKPISPAEKRT